MATRKVAMFLGIAVLMAGGFAATAKAQIPDQEILRAEIPFSFTIRNRTFPAGEYSIRQSPVGADSEFVLEIASFHGMVKPEIFETEGTIADAVPNHSKIVFDKIGNKYYLSKVFVQDSKDGNEVPMTGAEKKMLKRDRTSEQYELKVERWSRVEKADRNSE